MIPQHIPVLQQEIQDYAPQHTKTVLDCTLGAGGHSEALLTRFNQAMLVAIDRDPAALNTAKKRLHPHRLRTQFHHSSFSTLSPILGSMQCEFDYIIADIGISSLQLNQSERGFSFMQDGPLDMRMNPEMDCPTADYWINEATQEELANIFQKFGEERFARKIAHGIVEKRKIKKFSSTQQLAEYVKSLIPRRFQRQGFHPATLVFQALRIAVNDELQELESLLETAIKYLNTKGRLAVISFHSLEDRLVKHQFRQWEDPCTCPKDLPYCVCNSSPLGKQITKRPICPSSQEILKNPRSRSAKLRIFEYH
ncbi:MAG: 16S rRNA (cytosine(1402)-N(4))-methyltransferase RsmH [SAR324 cluster bacterium]|nr:16S rRNA (cytosine(1402)-N(4))-methyltransferase RsmH [SAR324 cluster bacterium]